MNAKKLDRYGMHATDCQCMRCEAGYRPTLQQRENARRSFEAAEQRRRAKEAKDAKAAGEAPKKLTQWERDAAAFEQTDRDIRKMSAVPERPATPEELAELKKQFGFGPRGKDGRR